MVGLADVRLRAGPLAIDCVIEPVVAQDPASRLTSARFGTFFSVSRSGVSRLAIISGSAAFFAPEMAIWP